MHSIFKTKRLKVLLIILGAVVVLAIIGFFIWRSTASASTGVEGIFGDLTLTVRDGQTEKPIEGATVAISSFNRNSKGYDNDLFNNTSRLNPVPSCSSFTLKTNKNGRVLFTKANKHYNLRIGTRIGVTIPLGGLLNIPANASSSCVYTITTTPPSGSAFIQNVQNGSDGKGVKWSTSLGQDTALTINADMDTESNVVDLMPPLMLTLNATASSGTPAGDVSKTKLPTGVALNSKVTLTYRAIGALPTTVCTASGGWSGKKDVSGGEEGKTEVTIAKAGDNNFILSCTRPKPMEALTITTTVVGASLKPPVTTKGTLTGKVTLKGKLQTSGTVKLITISDSKAITTAIQWDGTYTFKNNVPKGTYALKFQLNSAKNKALATKGPFNFTFPTNQSAYIYNLAF